MIATIVSKLHAVRSREVELRFFNDFVVRFDHVGQNQVRTQRRLLRCDSEY